MPHNFKVQVYNNALKGRKEKYFSQNNKLTFKKTSTSLLSYSTSSNSSKIYNSKSEISRSTWPERMKVWELISQLQENNWSVLLKIVIIPHLLKLNCRLKRNKLMKQGMYHISFKICHTLEEKRQKKTTTVTSALSYTSNNFTLGSFLARSDVPIS